MHITAVVLALAASTFSDVATASAKLQHHNHHKNIRGGYSAWAGKHASQTLPASTIISNHTLNPRDQPITNLLNSNDASRLMEMGCRLGENALSSGAEAWVGNDGSYINEFSNDSAEDLILVVWGPKASWVNDNTALITISLPQNTSRTISFQAGLSGAWSSVYNDTVMSMGQIANTWGEFTFNRDGVVDVSRLPNMSGHPMTIIGPTCTADMNTCAFICTAGDVCETEYALQNCANGSQIGASFGYWDGNPSGGCGWNHANSVALKTRFL